MNLCISQGNKKLGKLPNISMSSYTSCPGKSEWCVKKCYASKYEKIYPQCIPAYMRNMEISKSPDFVNIIIDKVKKISGPYFRIHTSGDFYNIKYIEKWIEICQSLPNILFSVYTRSWIIPELLSSLKELNKLKNVQIFLSTDPTMDLPPDGFRIAFIEEDERAKGIMCLYDSGLKNACSDCGYCFKNNKKNVIFKNKSKGRKK